MQILLSAHKVEILKIDKKNTGLYPKVYLITLNATRVGHDGSVGIATRYGLEGPGIEYRWGRYFPNPSTPALGPPIHWVPGLSRV